jgi:hypothetical protein
MMVWISTKPIFPKGRILNLECNGKEFWLYTRVPTKEELRTWLSRKENVYVLTTRGSHTMGEGMLEEEVAMIHRFKWTEPMLAIWQQRLCYHSAKSIEKTFENTT